MSHTSWWLSAHQLKLFKYNIWGIRYLHYFLIYLNELCLFQCHTCEILLYIGNIYVPASMSNGHMDTPHCEQTEWQTHMIENIIFPQLCWWVVIKLVFCAWQKLHNYTFQLMDMKSAAYVRHKTLTCFTISTYFPAHLQYLTCRSNILDIISFC